MKPEIVKQISSRIALEIMNSVVNIHNLLLEEDQRCAFFELGILVESLAERVRSETKSS